MSGIEWTEKTWNPITGCTKISLGCKNCYAERMARRLAGRYGYPEQPDHFKVVLRPDRLEQPLHWRKPRMVFVNSMSDLFHEDVPDSFIIQVFARMASSEHIFQILTKRHERMCDFVNEYTPSIENFSNVWLGITVESAKYVSRIDYLRRTPAAVRFVSFEPLLDDVAVALGPGHCQIDWAIVGGESGPNARSMYPEYARALREWARCWGIPFFFKQWGGARADVLEVRAWERAGRDFSQRKGGRSLDGRVWDEMPKGVQT